MTLQEGSRARDGDAGRVAYRAQPKVSDAVAAATFGLVGVAVCLMAVSAGWRTQRAGMAWGLGLPALLVFAGIAAALLWRYLDQGAVLKLSAAGLKARGLRQPLYWDEIEDVEYDEPRQRLLVHVGRNSGKGKSPQRVSLRRLARGERQAAFEAVLARVNASRSARGLGETRTTRELREAVAFEGRLAALTPRLYPLQAIVGLNVAVWLLQVALGVPMLAPSPEALYRWGGNSASAVLFDGEVWRLLTATVLHAGLLHLALNLVGLWEPGRQLARMLGNGPFVLVYLASGLCGSVASLHFSAQKAVAVGASGAVFGVFGALLACSWRHRDRLPAVNARRLWSGPAIFLLYSLVQGFTNPRIDNAAHVGGLAAGAVLGLLLVPLFEEAPARRRAAQAALGVVLAGLFVVIGTIATPVPRTWHGPLLHAAAVMNRVGPEYGRLAADVERLGREAKDAAAARAFMASEFLPRCAAIQRELATVRVPQWEPIGHAARILSRTCEVASEGARLDLAATTPQQRAENAQRMAELGLQLRQLHQQMDALQEEKARERRR